MIFFALFHVLQAQTGSVALQGELKKWHNVTLLVTGPTLSETGNPNPFTNYRLNVTFTQGATTFLVPGYFAADGNAANTNATSGNKWKVHFAPNATGTWNYSVSFRTGSMAAISDQANFGSAVSPDGATGSFSIAPNDKSLPDLRAKGHLDYVNLHYLQWQETGDFFIKGGADAPENFLGYYGFDNTVDQGGSSNTLNGTSSYTSQGVTYNYNGDGLHHYDAHEVDWNNGDPDWGNGKGKNIIGAINYLSSRGMNAFSFLTMNVGGDGQEVYPYVNYNNNNAPQNDRLVFDCSKLDQWEIVFTQGEAKGMYLHFKTQETENDQLLDGASLGNERKMYYRELIARFGHHLALNWNLGEENDIWQELNDPNNNFVKSYAQYIHDLDPYKNNIVIHTYPGQQNNVYTPCLGNNSFLSGASLQTNFDNVHNLTQEWVGNSASTPRPWVVANDEQGGADIGVKPAGSGNNHDDIRKYTLWGNLMAGGGGVEYYFGYAFPHSDLNCEDWRTREPMWDYTRIALDFFEGLPVSEMVNRDDLIGNSGNGNSKYCFAKVGGTYAIYLPDGGTTNLNLSGQVGDYDVRWIDPRNGGAQQTGSVSVISGGSNVSIGTAPSSTNNDWVITVVSQGVALPVELADFTAIPAGNDVLLTWSTLSESESDHFEILRSNDTLDWEKIGSVQSMGNASNINRYQYSDISLSGGLWYYVLRLVDINGNTNYSNRVQAYISGQKGTWSVGPNPVEDRLRINYSGMEGVPVTFELIAIDGKILRKQIVIDAHGVVDWEMGAIPNGIFLLKMTSASVSETFRVVHLY